MIALALAALVAAQAPTDPIERHIVRRLSLTSWGRTARGAAYARELGQRIRVEASRRVLDATALAAVGDVESAYQPWARGRSREWGPWQLMMRDGAVIDARLSLAGCQPPKALRQHLRAWWVRRQSDPGATCEAQEVADRRTWHGYWLATELADPTLGTYIAAREIAGHLERWRGRGYPVAVPSECVGIPASVPAMGHFNRPGSPTAHYMRRLCRIYRLIR